MSKATTKILAGTPSRAGGRLCGPHYQRPGDYRRRRYSSQLCQPKNIEAANSPPGFLGAAAPKSAFAYFCLTTKVGRAGARNTPSASHYDKKAPLKTTVPISDTNFRNVLATARKRPYWKPPHRWRPHKGRSKATTKIFAGTPSRAGGRLCGPHLQRAKDYRRRLYDYQVMPAEKL